MVSANSEKFLWFLKPCTDRDKTSFFLRTKIIGNHRNIDICLGTNISYRSSFISFFAISSSAISKI
jgi:hypothetical protein